MFRKMLAVLLISLIFLNISVVLIRMHKKETFLKEYVMVLEESKALLEDNVKILEGNISRLKEDALIFRISNLYSALNTLQLGTLIVEGVGANDSVLELRSLEAQRAIIILNSMQVSLSDKKDFPKDEFKEKVGDLENEFKRGDSKIAIQKFSNLIEFLEKNIKEDDTKV